MLADNDIISGGTVTRGIDDYHRGDHFWLMRIACELRFGNIPDGVRFKFTMRDNRAMTGRVALGRLFLDDGRYMKPANNGTWEWGKVVR